MNHISNTYIRQVILLIIITLLGITIFWQLRMFLPALLGAYTFYILMRKWMFKLITDFKWKKSLAALALMLLSAIVILLPLNGLLGILTAKILPTIEHSKDIWASVEQMIHNVEQRYNIDILTQENFRNLGDWAVKEGRKLLGATFNGIAAVVVMYFILYFMLTEGHELERSYFRWLPLSESSVAYLKKHLNALVFSNAIGIPLVAFLQGLVALIGYWLTGVQEPFLWFVATCIAAVIPVLGAMLVYIPLALMLIANGGTIQGIILFAYGFLIIGSVDNIFRFWLQKRIGDTHPLITIFGVIIGLNLFGFIGLIFGPILISLFLLLMTIYGKEFNRH
jgi:predicted PurR-regulated permease PerM